MGQERVIIAEITILPVLLVLLVLASQSLGVQGVVGGGVRDAGRGQGWHGGHVRPGGVHADQVQLRHIWAGIVKTREAGLVTAETVSQLQRGLIFPHPAARCRARGSKDRGHVYTCVTCAHHIQVQTVRGARGGLCWRDLTAETGHCLIWRTDVPVWPAMKYYLDTDQSSHHHQWYQIKWTQ